MGGLANEAGRGKGGDKERKRRVSERGKDRTRLSLIHIGGCRRIEKNERRGGQQEETRKKREREVGGEQEGTTEGKVDVKR